MGTKDLIAHFFAKDGLTRLIEVLNYESKSQKGAQRIDYKMLSPLIYSIPFMFDLWNDKKISEACQQFTEATALLFSS